MKSLITLIFWRDLVIRYLTLIAIILQIGLWVLIIAKIVPIAGQADFLSLHYNIYFGIDLIGSWYKIFTVPIVGLIFLIINICLIVVLYQREKFLSYFLAASNFLISLGLFVALTLIVLLNI
ncbi:hypothetical protein GWN91_02975 [Candidatus Saccharibacteria bacterium]|nr:hypothetical protein [Candidatus Saccharibacteria bacterium]NIS38141.1 hypothetical protein [Candidatus Saccharibacteria bacterium]NIW78880.1 hypothetical protein [Calditrichia bacterium]